MGLLINGQWNSQATEENPSQGSFIRKSSQFRHWVSADGSSGFKAEAHRYHLYISYACPWACRCLIFRQLKQLENIISFSVVDPLMLENGWEFSENFPDPIEASQYLYELYLKSDAHYSGKVTVPVLWDTKESVIVNNESSEIIRMFNSEFNEFTHNELDFYPEAHREVIDEINQFIYKNINNGVYQCGFATTQSAYEEAFHRLFNALDKVEERLSQQKYLIDSTLTEADWRLFTTLIRFDVVYYFHFKCNQQRIQDYPHLFQYMKKLYNMPGVAETVHFDHIKQHYYGSHRMINPLGIIPLGPKKTI